MVLLAAAPGCSVFLSGEADGDGDAGADLQRETLSPDNVDVVDTWLYEPRPDDGQGEDELLRWDADRSEDPLAGQAVALLRFELSGGPIPEGAEVVSATLQLTVVDHGDVARLLEVLTSWDEGTTWNTFGAEPGLISAVDFSPDPVGAVFTNGHEGQIIDIDVTDSVSAWVAGTRDNLGWLFLPDGSNGVDVYSSEAGDAFQPKLSVEFRRRRD